MESDFDPRTVGEVQRQLAVRYREVLTLLGEDPARPGLRDTPDRVARMIWNLTHPEEPKLTTFPVEDADEMVILRDVPFFSLCEHHLVPFYGKAHIGYLPGDRLVGLSKLARVVDYFARRLQIQERLTRQIADYLMEHVEPTGVGVILEAEHLCMSMRGARRPGHSTQTSALLGTFRDEAGVRSEFLSLVRRNGG